MNQPFANMGHLAVGDNASPDAAQKSYLARGLSEPGGKLPLFGADGLTVSSQLVRACIARGWCEPWIANPLKPDWIVCRLTVSGYQALGADPPSHRMSMTV